MSDQRLKMAVFIDFDNVEIGVKTTLGLAFDIGAVLEALKERGEIVTKVAYGDWKRGEYGRAMAQHAVRLVQRVMTPGGDKNGADINLALDALEMAFTHDHINAFAIVGGDSDFITLVEKLKQYDRKVFVVGGRAFTSQVMQKNCTEFIAYENIVGARRGADRSRPVGQTMKLDQAVPLVRRALKVLADREVSPQLGLLKSTLLQLDSSFSERDYGVSTFRDFAEKLAELGVVTLRHAGRSILVDLADGAGASADTPAAPAGVEGPEAGEPAAPTTATDAAPPPLAPRPAAVDAAVLAAGVALVRRALADPPQPPRWPMYLRQVKQFLRAFDPAFDERTYGSIVELVRACQKEGLVRIERDRHGGLRVFAEGAQVAPVPVSPARPGAQPTGQPYRPKTVPLGWVIGSDDEATGEGPAAGEPAAAAAGTVTHEDAQTREDVQPARPADPEGAAPDAVPDAAHEPSSRTAPAALASGIDPAGQSASAPDPARDARDAAARASGEHQSEPPPAAPRRARRTRAATSAGRSAAAASSRRPAARGARTRGKTARSKSGA